MSTGKRLAKRSIIGTRVAAPGDDGKYYAGMIQAVKTPASFPEPNNCINLTPNTLYTVRFDSKAAVGKRHAREYRDTDLIGPGFRSLAGLQLAPGQRVYLTHNGREVRADLLAHDAARDELRVLLHVPGAEAPLELSKRLDEVRLLESRKSARLADTDTDFARLADMAGDRRRVSTTIDVPHPHAHPQHPSRKRRPSACGSLERDDLMDECNAALVLMSLSCSPHSPRAAAWGGRSSVSPGASSSDGSAGSWRSGTPSPPPPSSSFSDEGIAMDYSPQHDSKKARRVVFECTWPGCGARTASCAAVELHVRRAHLGERGPERHLDREEEFYYTERELSADPSPPPPTLSHRDMCRPPHEDPDYQRQLVGSYRQGLLSMQATELSAAAAAAAANWPAAHSPKHMRLSAWPAPASPASPAAPASPARRPRSENKKCRKVYGMEHREHWCTQCKWKKACTRFGD